MLRIAAALGCALLLAGCAARRAPLNYRLLERDGARILVPPGIIDPALAERTLVLRSAARPAATCALPDAAIDVKPRRGALRITVRRKPLSEKPQGWLSRWAVLAEQKGCVAPGGGLRLAGEIADAVPLDPSVASTLFHPNLRTGYLDLGPEHRLRVIAPILRAGGQSALQVSQVTGEGHSLAVEAKASPDFLGYETVWYSVEPRSDGNGGRIELLSAESHVDGKVSPSTAPQADYLPFAPEARHFRLFFLTRVSQSDHDMAILGARTRAGLEEATPRFEADPAGFAKAAGAGMCVLVARVVALAPHFAVTANGKEIRVGVESAVGDAIHAAGVADPSKVLPALVVRRRCRGQLTPVDFDRTRGGILGLPLRGGEDIRW